MKADKKVVLVVFAFLSLLLIWKVPPIVNAQTSNPPTLQLSEVAVDSANGFGSTGVYARTYANIDVNVGSDITYASSSTNGDSWTINTPGVYSMSWSDEVTSGDTGIISLNTAGTTTINSASIANKLCWQALPSNIATSCSVTLGLNVNDVVRVTFSTGGNCSCTNATSVGRFIITRVR